MTDDNDEMRARVNERANEITAYLGRVLINRDCLAIAGFGNRWLPRTTYELRSTFRRFSAAVATRREGHRSPELGRAGIRSRQRNRIRHWNA